MKWFAVVSVGVGGVLSVCRWRCSDTVVITVYYLKQTRHSSTIDSHIEYIFMYLNMVGWESLCGSRKHIAVLQTLLTPDSELFMFWRITSSSESWLNFTSGDLFFKPGRRPTKRRSQAEIKAVCLISPFLTQELVLSVASRQNQGQLHVSRRVHSLPITQLLLDGCACGSSYLGVEQVEIEVH